MKKMISLIALTLLLCSAMSVTTFAHGHGKGHHNTTRQSNYKVCTVEGCVETGLHEHSGQYYYCRNHGAGGCGRITGK